MRYPPELQEGNPASHLTAKAASVGGLRKAFFRTPQGWLKEKGRCRV
jgi:hypothetical protein